MKSELKKLANTAWWIFLLRGIGFVLLGLLLLVKPIGTTALILLAFGIYLLFDGLFAVVFSIFNHKVLPKWGWEMVRGLLGVIVGLFAISRPILWTGVAALTLFLIFGATLVLMGILQIIAMIHYKSWSMFFGAALSILLGALFFANPGAWMVTFVMLMGIILIINGLVNVLLGFQFEKASKKLK
ncbi:hypothetical protein GOV07_01685 [Candidatus Woesearchaeota archaeon]|nr:hypothetical protein [Candidatus Woesearchaeota archaeon]